MIITDNLIKLVSHYESLHDGDTKKIGLQPKMCPAGYWTEGYGSVILDDKGIMLKGIANRQKAYKFSKIKTEVQAMQALKLGLEKYMKQVISLVGNIEQNKLDALTSFTYNLGSNALKKSTLLEYIKSGKSNEEIYAQFLRWNKAGGTVLRGLTNRRNSEATLFTTGTLKYFN